LVLYVKSLVYFALVMPQNAIELCYIVESCAASLSIVRENVVQLLATRKTFYIMQQY